ncbi:Subtilase family protein [Actinacidiphila alni]|uniref:Subtilase family protein n=1 Tax=Actinacidiphila alni TaxID=380248 RepID=A0A1I2J3U3_9ACTN|nr:S8 family serine peptidase [Actinacidiphila alni]SFF47401.1 Subtilase family protein [Actinacidiphila alni]
MTAFSTPAERRGGGRSARGRTSGRSAASVSSGPRAGRRGGRGPLHLSRLARRPLSVLLAAAATLLAVPATVAHADSGAPVTPAPTASGAAGAIRLPVVPGRLSSGAACTKASGTTVKTVPWAQQSLQLARAQQLSRGAGVTVAVVDTGVSPGAPALAGRVTANGDAAKDCVGHGTFIAGVIAAAPVGGGALTGVAPGARVLAERGTDATGVPDAGRVAAAIRAAVDAGAKVIDVSAALPAATAALTSAVDYAAGHDVLVVAAAVPDSADSAGQGDSVPKAYWPAAAPGVLSVVDVDVTGARASGAPEPTPAADLSAPGQGVTGIGPSGTGHFLGNGASVASAFVAGTAALVRSYHPELTAAQVAQRLIATAYPAAVPRVDPAGAVGAVLPGARTSADPGSAGITLPAPTAEHDMRGRALTLLALCALALLGVVAAVALAARAKRTAAPGTAAPTPAPDGPSAEEPALSGTERRALSETEEPAPDEAALTPEPPSLSGRF